MQRTWIAALCAGAALIALAVALLGPSSSQVHEGVLAEGSFGDPTAAPIDDLAASLRSIRRASEEVAAEPPPRKPTRPTARVTSSADALRTIFVGRCLDAETSAPLAGCIVRPPRSGKVIALDRTARVLEHPSEVATDAEGRFEFEIEHRDFRSIDLELRHPGYGSRAGTFALDDRGTRDLGDLLLARAAQVRGLVLDESGARVEGAHLQFRGQAAAIAGSAPLYVEAHARSGADGRFELENGLTPGRWSLRQRSDLQHELVAPEHVDVGTTAIDLVVTVQPMLAIRGRVLDEVGAPIARAMLVCGCCDKGQRSPATADERGLFALLRSCRTCTTTTVRVLPGTAEAAELSGIAWGQTGIELMTRRSPVLAIEVADEESGKPIEEFRIQLWSATPDPAQPLRIFLGETRTGDGLADRRPGRVQRHAGGVLHQEGVPRGEYELRVIPGGTRYLPSEAMPLRVEDGAAKQILVLLSRKPLLEVRIVDAERTPIAGARAELLRHRPREGSPIAFPAEVIAYATSDERGIASIHGGVPRESLALRIRSPQHAMQLRENIVLQSSKEQLEIVLHRGATLRGVLTPPALAELGVHLCFAPSPEATAIAMAQDGRFELENAPAGRWSIWIRALGGFTSEPIATLELPREGTCSVEVDGAVALPATLEGSVRVHGVAFRASELTLQRVEAPGSEASTLKIDAAGRFDLVRLFPGRYRAALSLEDTEGSQPRLVDLEIAETLELACGEKKRLELDFAPRRARFVLLDRTGKPWSGKSMVRMETRRRRDLRLGLADEHGAVELAVLPGLRFALRAGGQRAPANGWLELAAGSTKHEEQITLGR